MKTVTVDDVYEKETDIGRLIFRRIIGVREGVVVYSKGDDKIYHCLPSTFFRWAKSHDVIKIHSGSASNERIEKISDDVYTYRPSEHTKEIA